MNRSFNNEKINDINKDRIKELKNLAKLIAVTGVRNNTDLEDLHCGTTPSSKTGDYTDVKVISPYGTIEWNYISRISDDEMCSLMLSVELAIEKALIMYEACDDKEKAMLIDFHLSQRSYDCPHFTKV